MRQAQPIPLHVGRGLQEPPRKTASCCGPAWPRIPSTAGVWNRQGDVGPSGDSNRLLLHERRTQCAGRREYAPPFTRGRRPPAQLAITGTGSRTWSIARWGAPDLGGRDDVKFAFVNCQNLQEGLYPVYRDTSGRLARPGATWVTTYDSAQPRRPQEAWTKAPVDLVPFMTTRTTRWTGISGRACGASLDLLLGRSRGRRRPRAILPGTDPGRAARKRAGSYAGLPTSTCRSRPTSRVPNPSTT